MTRELTGLILTLAAVAFTAWFAFPETRIGQHPLNDIAFHLAASERMETAFERGEPFLDPWVSEWALGYPVWRSYQPLPHVVAAVVIHLFRPIDPARTFAWFYWAVLSTLPVSVYIGARWFGLSPVAAGLAAILVYAPTSAGLLSGYDLGYSAFVWRGIGLYTQLFALHFFILSIGATARALDSGVKRWRIMASVLLALTAVSHIVFGYAAFGSAVVIGIL